jgi:hypothetical protein
LLVGGFQPCRHVDGIAIGGVVEEATAAEVADDRRSGMNTDTCDPSAIPLLPALAE